jgi:two-component system, response regulator
MKTVEMVLVEDNPDDVELTLRALRKSNFTNPIRVLRDGAEALDYLFGADAAGQPHMSSAPVVMLLDLKLPKVTGIEVLQRVKADPRTRSIPVVVMTSSREDRDLQETYKLGANSYIVKPVDFEQFNRAVTQIGMYWLLINQQPEV